MLNCVVTNCNVTQGNKTPGIFLHPCPQSVQMRKQWQTLLKTKCNHLDWQTSRICSKHFENKYFDSNRRLKDNAIPTKFSSNLNDVSSSGVALKANFDGLLGKQGHKQLHQDIHDSLERLEEPSDLHEYIAEDMQPQSDAPTEAQLWLILKKQNHLINKLMESESSAQSALELSKIKVKELQKNADTQTYLIKTLQEKQSTLEEQIEILTVVESR